MKITGKVSDALMDAVAQWDLEVDMGYPFKVRGTAQDLVVTMMAFAGDPRVDQQTSDAVAARVIIEPQGDQFELTLLMTNVILP